MSIRRCAQCYINRRPAETITISNDNNLHSSPSAVKATMESPEPNLSLSSGVLSTTPIYISAAPPVVAYIYPHHLRHKICPTQPRAFETGRMSAYVNGRRLAWETGAGIDKLQYVL